MKKTTLNILSLFVIAVLLVFSFASCKSSKQCDSSYNNETRNDNLSAEYNNETRNDNLSAEPPSSSTPSESSDNGTDTETNKPEDPDVPPASMADALFIGDSRTVGMMEYAGLTEANYFCSIGMNVFNIKKNRVSVPSVGKVTLEELLSHKKYGKIYIMLGINELGYDFQSIINKYGDLLDFVNGKQPNAAIFIQANLHVSKKRSDSDKYINNKNIDRLNSELSKSANGKSTFYIDANPLFDDKDGNLSLDKTSDNAHLYARYYTEGGEWICKETAKVLKERQS